MKTQEEIDELYHKLYDISLDGEDTLHYYSFIEGYKQCQEDMAKEIEVKEPKYADKGDYCAVCGCTEFWNDEEE